MPTRRVPMNRHDAEIHVRGQSCVELNLGLTSQSPLVERREVQEPEVDRLFDLEGPVRTQEDPRSMRLEALGAVARQIVLQLAHAAKYSMGCALATERMKCAGRF